MSDVQQEMTDDQKVIAWMKRNRVNEGMSSVERAIALDLENLRNRHLTLQGHVIRHRDDRARPAPRSFGIPDDPED